jgi:hypothetical protein
MSLRFVVQVGASTAQHMIEAAGGTLGDRDALLLRAGLLDFLQMHASTLTPDEEERDLLSDYIDWLQTAAQIYSTGDASLAKRYIETAARLTGSIELAKAREQGLIAPPTSEH